MSHQSKSVFLLISVDFCKISQFLDDTHLPSFACSPNHSCTFRIWNFVVIDPLLKNFPIVLTGNKKDGWSLFKIFENPGNPSRKKALYLHWKVMSQWKDSGKINEHGWTMNTSIWYQSLSIGLNVICTFELCSWSAWKSVYFNCPTLQYKIGQLYMIAKHSHEQSEKGEGVEIVKNEDCTDPVHGKGRYTEKRVHLSKYAYRV